MHVWHSTGCVSCTARHATELMSLGVCVAFGWARALQPASDGSTARIPRQTAAGMLGHACRSLPRYRRRASEHARLDGCISARVERSGSTNAQDARQDKHAKSTKDTTHHAPPAKSTAPQAQHPKQHPKHSTPSTAPQAQRTEHSTPSTAQKHKKQKRKGVVWVRATVSVSTSCVSETITRS